MVSNSTASPTPATVYAADGITADTTGVSFADDGQPPHGAGAWVTPAATSVMLAPNSQQTIAFSVQVPASATPGDHVAAVVVQQAATSGGGSVSISQVVRGVVPIDVQVSGAAAEQAQLDAPTLGTLAGTGQTAVLVPIVDSGSLMCRPTLTVTVTSSATGATATVTRQLDLLLPGDSITYPFSWPSQLSPGTYDVTTTVSGCGTTTSTHATDTIAAVGSTLADTPPPPAPIASAPRAAHPGSTPGEPSPAHQPRTSGDTPAPSVTSPSTSTPTQGSTATPAPVSVSPPALTAASAPAVAAPRTPHRRHAAPPAGAGAGTSAAAAPAPPHPVAAGRTVHGTRTGDTSPLATILRTARTVLTTTAFPLALLIVMFGFIVMQDAIDRRDPKLALAPAYSDPELSFGADPPGAPEPSVA